MPGFQATMHEWAQDGLHSGSKKGPIVPHSKAGQKKALAIAFSEARQAGEHVPPPPGERAARSLIRARRRR